MRTKYFVPARALVFLQGHGVERVEVPGPFWSGESDLVVNDGFEVRTAREKVKSMRVWFHIRLTCSLDRRGFGTQEQRAGEIGDRYGWRWEALERIKKILDRIIGTAAG